MTDLSSCSNAQRFRTAHFSNVIDIDIARRGPHTPIVCKPGEFTPAKTLAFVELSAREFNKSQSPASDASDTQARRKERMQGNASIRMSKEAACRMSNVGSTRS